MIQEKRILFCLLLILFLTPSAKGDQVRVFKIQFRPAEEILEMVKAVLSEKGRVTVDKRTNSLVVRDSAAALRRVKRLLSTLDAAPVNVSITVSQIGAADMEALGVSVKWARRGGGWAVGNLERRADGTTLGVTAGKKIQSSKVTVRRRLVVLSGSKGTWTVGRRIAVKGSGAAWPGTLNAWVREAGATHVQSEFTIEPVVRGDRVLLTITPGAVLFSGTEKNRRRFTGAQMTTVVKDGDTVLIGSDQREQRSEVTEALQGFSQTRGKSSSCLLIEVKILK